MAFEIGQIAPRKMVAWFTEKYFFIFQMAKSLAYYALFERTCLFDLPPKSELLLTLGYVVLFKNTMP